MPKNNNEIFFIMINQCRGRDLLILGFACLAYLEITSRRHPRIIETVNKFPTIGFRMGGKDRKLGE